MKHNIFKYKVKSTQNMTKCDNYEKQNPMSCDINKSHEDIMNAIPEKKQEDYSPQFIEWFVNFHAELLHIQDWDKFPEWMIPLLKKRAEEIHEGLHFDH